jgi:hypothetical protein
VAKEKERRVDREYRPSSENVASVVLGAEQKRRRGAGQPVVPPDAANLGKYIYGRQSQWLIFI